MNCYLVSDCLRPNIENGIAYARSIDDDFGMRGEEQGWDHNIPDGHNISIICGAGTLFQVVKYVKYTMYTVNCIVLKPLII